MSAAGKFLPNLKGPSGKWLWKVLAESLLQCSVHTLYCIKSFSALVYLLKVQQAKAMSSCFDIVKCCISSVVISRNPVVITVVIAKHSIYCEIGPVGIVFFKKKNSILFFLERKRFRLDQFRSKFLGFWRLRLLRLDCDWLRLDAKKIGLGELSCVPLKPNFPILFLRNANLNANASVSNVQSVLHAQWRCVRVLLSKVLAAISNKIHSDW